MNLLDGIKMLSSIVSIETTIVAQKGVFSMIFMRHAASMCKKVTKYKGEILLLLSVFLLFSSGYKTIYQVPYIGDDTINSGISGILLTQNQNTWEFTKSIILSWTKGGRVFPFAFYMYFLFDLLPNLVAYRTFLIVLNIGVLVLLSRLVYVMTKNYKYSLLSICMCLLLFQFRVYHDPILAYHGLLQFVTSCLLAAILFQIKALETRKFRYILFSSLFYLTALLTYEISYGFVLLIFIISLKKKHYPYAIPHIILTIVLLACTLGLRSLNHGAGYSGTNFSINVDVIKTFFIQMKGAIPLDYLCNLTLKERTLFTILHNYVDIWDILFTIVYAITIFFLISTREETHMQSSSLLLIGVAFWIVPAGILAFSERYQQELISGLAHLSVYTEYIGASMCLVFMIGVIFSRIKRSRTHFVVALILAIISGTIFLFNHVSNKIVQQSLYQSSNQSISEQALKHGLIDSVESGAHIIAIGGGGGVFHDFASYIGAYTERTDITAENFITFVDKYVQETEKNRHDNEADVRILYPDNLYAFDSVGDLSCGFAKLMKVDRLDIDSGSRVILQVYGTEMNLYICGEDKLQLAFGMIGDDKIATVDIALSQILTQDSYNQETFQISRISDLYTQGTWERFWELYEEDSFIAQIHSTDPILFDSLCIR